MLFLTNLIFQWALYYLLKQSNLVPNLILWKKLREYCEEEMWVWVFPHHKCQKILSNHESKTSDLTSFWHEWCGKTHTHISDLTVFSQWKFSTKSYTLKGIDLYIHKRWTFTNSTLYGWARKLLIISCKRVWCTLQGRRNEIYLGEPMAQFIACKDRSE